jgi:uncharacterized protein (TIGR04255 family)
VTRRIYPRPPIVEAVIDFRFSPGGLGTALLDTLVDALGETYPGDQKKQEMVEVQAHVRDDSVAAAARRAHHLTFLQSGDGLRLVGCGDGMLSFHVLAPYPGWESFIDMAVEGMAAVAEGLEGETVRQIAVRYIDRIAVPVDSETSFDELLTSMPAKPPSMPGVLTGFHFVTQTVDAEDGTLATLTLASAPPDDAGRPVAIYDLTVQRGGSPLCGPGESEWRPLVEALHDRQRAIFEDSITDRLRETFQ